MKSIIHLLPAFLFLMGLSFNSLAAIATPDRMAREKPKKESVFKQLPADEIFTMPRKDIEAKIGRKLKFKEKLGLFIVRKAIKKAAGKRTKEPRNENLMGILSLSFGVLSFIGISLGAGGGAFVLLIAVLSIAAAIAFGVIGLKRKEPKRILSILGLVIGGVLFLLFILLFLILLLMN